MKRAITRVGLAAVTAAAVLLSGCATPGPVAGLYPPDAGQPAETVYLLRHGRHVSIIVPTARIRHDLWPEAANLPPCDFVELGWANRYYNMSSDAEWRRVCGALFWPGRSILEVVPLRSRPDDYCTGNTLVRINVSSEGFRRVCAFIGDTYDRSTAGSATVLASDPVCIIYKARGRYCVMNTSNTWTARALREAGCPISPFRCVTADPLLSQVGRFGTVIREQQPVSESPRPD